MKKYPFSKQAIKVMLAAALITSPLTASLPLFNGSVVEAKEVDVAEIINEELGDGTAEEIAKDVAAILYESDPDTIESKLQNLKEDHEDNLSSLFDDDIDIDTLLDFLTKLEGKLKEEINDGNKDDIVSQIFAKGFNNYMEKHINKVLEENPELDNANDVMKEKIGIEFSSFLKMKDRLESKLELSSSEKINLMTGLASAYVASEDEFENPDDKVENIANKLATIHENLDDEEKEIVKEINKDIAILDESDWREILGKGNIDDDSSSGGSGGSGGSSGGGSGSGGGGSDDDDSDQDETPGTPPEDTYEDERVTDEDGTERVIRHVDSDKLEDYLDNQEEVETVRLTVEKEEGEQGEIRIPQEAIGSIHEKNPNATVEVRSTEGSIYLPVSTLVTTEDGSTVRVAVNSTTEGTEVLEENNLTATSPIVEFRASIISSDGEERELDNFDRHITREINGDEAFDPNAVVLRLGEDGDFVAAPTIINEETATFKTQYFSRYVVVEHEKTFVDVPNDYWAKDQFDKLGSRFIFQGRSDGTVAPGEEMRRAQFAALIVRSLGLSAESEYAGEFVDVDEDDWFTEEIQPAIEQGIIQGRKDGTFAPNDRVTRQQAAAMLSRAMDITGFNEEELDIERTIQSFEDVERIGEWAQPHVERLMQAGVIDGRDDGRIFDPKTGTSRAQMAKMLDEYLTFIDFMN
ncbi:S-layer homology domain-containing protein [Alteribacillus iranensis]|uniref:S-layer homology domain-containing protein n=1 Tax=Alteribacillus iranensis TaxID=930128 RepID=A0A1I2B315_9BACI|nr:S-layer homology domain-containing protein [Alteribacillus iranensis]SFE49560.1 S-layer homology domain-containing protein [Alteribacillus iranensis]